MSSYTEEDILMIENARALDLLFEQSVEIAKLKAMVEMLAENANWSSMSIDNRQQELEL